jgi:hypothetical protein
MPSFIPGTESSMGFFSVDLCHLTDLDFSSAKKKTNDSSYAFEREVSMVFPLERYFRQSLSRYAASATARFTSKKTKKRK